MRELLEVEEGAPPAEVEAPPSLPPPPPTSRWLSSLPLGLLPHPVRALPALSFAGVIVGCALSLGVFLLAARVWCVVSTIGGDSPLAGGGLPTPVKGGDGDAALYAEVKAELMAARRGLLPPLSTTSGEGALEDPGLLTPTPVALAAHAAVASAAAAKGKGSEGKSPKPKRSSPRKKKAPASFTF